MSKHTPLPYAVGGTITLGGDKLIAIEDSGPQVPCIVAYVPFNTTDGGKTDHSKANAAFIVKACNNHERLLEAVRDVTVWFRTWERGECRIGELAEAIKDAESAIAEAGKEAT